jgi:hypothetical protein
MSQNVIEIVYLILNKSKNKYRISSYYIKNISHLFFLLTKKEIHRNP